MATELVIAVYRPKAGKERELAALVAAHVPMLREQGLATGRSAIAMRSLADGTVLEVFEWVSREAARIAHENEVVQRTWQAMEEVADFATLGELEEAARRFPHFQPM